MTVGVTINCQAPSSSGSPGPVGPPGSTRYCGSVQYSPLTHLCCNLQVNMKLSSSFRGCCGSVAYDPLKHVCCSGVLQTKKTGHYCCGTKLYHYAKQLCCNRKVMAKPWPSARCCGDIPYDNLKQTCCIQRNLGTTAAVPPFMIPRLSFAVVAWYIARLFRLAVEG